MQISAGPRDLGTVLRTRQIQFVGAIFAIIFLFNLVDYTNAKVSFIADWIVIFEKRKGENSEWNEWERLWCRNTEYGHVKNEIRSSMFGASPMNIEAI